MMFHTHNKNIVHYCLFALLHLLLLLILSPATSHAHIEKGFMPDALAEVEYLILLDFEPENIEVRNKLGIVLIRKKKFKEAELEFSKVLQTKADDFDGLDSMGLVKSLQGQFAEALPFLLKAIAVKEDDPLVYYHLGKVYEGLGENNTAMQKYLQALEWNQKILDTGQAERQKMIQTAIDALMKK